MLKTRPSKRTRSRICLRARTRGDCTGQPSAWSWEFADTSATTVVPASRVYDSAGRLVQNELGTYTYDSAGRITSLTQQLYKPSNTTTSSTAITATTAVYSIGYDSLGRISSFSRAGGSGAASTAPLATQTAIFTYDANGNRLSSIQSVGSGTATSTTNRSYTVDPTSNRLLGFAQTLTTGTGTGGATANISYQYDANGALLKDGLRSYEFDAANRLADVTTGAGIDAPTTRYVHNALGQRLFKTEPQFPPVASGSNPNDPAVIQILTNFFASLWGGTTTTATPSAGEKLGYQYCYDEDGNLLGEIGAGGSQSTGNAFYVYLPTPSGPMPIAAVINAKQYAVHTDHLNTPRRLTQSDKRVAWQWAFSAFGDEQPTTGKNRYVDPTTTPNAGSTTIADVTFNLRYPGQYFDKESNLHYNYFRSYDAKTGRYTQSDPIDLAGGWNRFAYGSGNPLSATDPLGLADFAVQFNGGAGTLWVTPPGSTSSQGFAAGNNTTSSSRGAWAPGTYTYGYSTAHRDDAPGSSYGANGNAVFNVPGCVGCGVHSGRESVLDRRGGSGVRHVTEGCIRTTDDATQLIQDLIRQGHRPVLEVTR
jgi:RHS repeat-associated protein